MFFNDIRNRQRIDLQSFNNTNFLFSSKKLKRIDTYAIMKTSADGNCLWNAISNALFGNENYMPLLRLFTYFCFLKYYSYFLNVCRYETHCIDFYIREVLTLGAWGRDIHVLALSLVLKRSIYIYEKISKKKPTLSRGRSITGIQSDKFPVLIFYNRNHYETIIPNSNNELLLSPQLVIYKEVDNEESFF